MICPNCGAEYRLGFTTCADCDVELVEAPPEGLKAPGSRAARQGPAFSRAPGDPNDDPFCSFWKGADARVCTELCTVLDEAGIPHKTIHRQDHLFNFANQVPYELGVPASFYERAENAIKEAFGTDEETEGEAVPLLPAPDRAPADFEKELRDAIVDANEWLGERYPEDATVEVWSGREADTKEMIRMSLEENNMMSRSEEDAGRAKVFVLPEDAQRAREIVREIVEGQPPE